MIADWLQFCEYTLSNTDHDHLMSFNQFFINGLLKYVKGGIPSEIYFGVRYTIFFLLDRPLTVSRRITILYVWGEHKQDYQWVN